MKVKTDKEVYTIPCDSGIHLLVLNKESEAVVEYMQTYFIQRKKYRYTKSSH